MPATFMQYLQSLCSINNLAEQLKGMPFVLFDM